MLRLLIIRVQGRSQVYYSKILAETSGKGWEDRWIQGGGGGLAYFCSERPNGRARVPSAPTPLDCAPVRVSAIQTTNPSPQFTVKINVAGIRAQNDTDNASGDQNRPTGRTGEIGPKGRRIQSGPGPGKGIQKTTCCLRNFIGMHTIL